MPSDFTKTLIDMARYWPDLYHCRADLFCQLFCTGYRWKDGRLGERASQEAHLAGFYSSLRSSKQIHDDMDARSRNFYHGRVMAIETEIAQAKEQGLPWADLEDTRLRFLKSLDRKPKRFRPCRIRTDAQVQAVVRDRRHRHIIRCARQHKFIKGTWKDKGLTTEQAWAKYSGQTVLSALYPSCACMNVPDDVRPDWLVGVGEFLDMIMAWDSPDQFNKASHAKARLEERFGRSELWSKLKRRPPIPLSVLEPRTIVGRKVRVDFGDERSWGEHRPDLGSDVYRSLNFTLSNVKLNVPEGHEAFSRNGKPCNMAWGHLFTGKEKRYGNVVPQFIIGMASTPLPDLEA